MEIEYIWLVIQAVGVIGQLCGAVACFLIFRTNREIRRNIAAMDDSGPRFSSPIETLGDDGKFRKLPRLSRRMPEPEPGGTKVYPREAWDEGLERTDV